MLFSGDCGSGSGEERLRPAENKALKILEINKNTKKRSQHKRFRKNTGGHVEYDYNNISAVYKTMYENASKITVNSMCRK